MPQQRDMSVKVLATLPPEKVTADGKDIPFEYIPEELAVKVSMPGRECNSRTKLVFTFPENASLADGTIGNMKRFVNAFSGLKDHFVDLEVTPEFGRMAVIYEALGYHPENAASLIDEFKGKHRDIGTVADNQPMPDEARKWFILHAIPSK